MKIVFLGTSHGYPEKDRFSSSTAVFVGKNCYLIDAGAPITTLLYNRDVDLNDVKGIFITHKHDDHYQGLVEYVRTICCHRKNAGIKNTVYQPEYFTLGEMLNPIYYLSFLKKGGQVKFKKYKRSGLFFDDGVAKVTAIPVKHIPFAHAFLFEAEGKKILFSGDLRPGMPDYPAVLFGEHIDMLVLEAAHTALNDQNIIEKVNNSKIDHLYINHISPQKNPHSVITDMFSKLRNGIACHVANDGDEFEL